MNIPLLIRELLLRHERAVIPGFGTFFMVHRPAELNKSTGVMLPPAKAIVFDHLERADDGQLTDLVMHKKPAKKTEAVAVVAAFVKTMEEQLGAQGTMFLEGIGDLRLELSGKYHFKPLDELLGRVNMFSLPRIDIPAARPAAVQPLVPAAGVVAAVASRHRKRRWWIPVTLAVVLAGFFAVVYITGLYERFRGNDQDIVITSGPDEKDNRLVFGNRSDTTDTLQAKISRELENRTDRERALMYEEPANPPEGQGKNDRTETVATDNTVGTKPYQIIAGSFQHLSNAEKQRAQLEKKGFQAVLLPKRGRFYMVSLGSYDSHDQASAALKQLRSELEQELWVMKK